MNKLINKIIETIRNDFGEIKNYSNGQFIQSTDNKKLDIICPLNGEVITKVVLSNKDDLNNIVDNIKTAQKQWAALTLKKRVEVIYKYRSLLIENMQTLAQIIFIENGKCLNDAKAEIMKAIETVEYACAISNSCSNQSQEVSKNVWASEEYRALGIVSSITPFNFPVMVPHWTIAHAIVMGNAMILKPSELTPIAAAYIANLWEQAGLPKGIYNVFNGDKEAVEALVNHPDIKAISFVGSSEVAKIVYQKGSYNLKRVIALGGAKNHLIIDNDIDFTSVTRDVISSAFGMVGQRCMAASVIIKIGEKLSIENELVKTLRAMKLGPDVDFQNGLSPLVSETLKQKIVEYIALARSLGAKILVNGLDFKAENEYIKGFYVGPTLIDWSDVEISKIPQYEVFGPVLEIIKANNLQHAIEIQNNSPYGNAASVFTDSGLLSSTLIKSFDSGMLGVNIGVPVPREPLSFGGTKMSKFGHGDITGRQGIDFWSNLIKVTTKWNYNMKKDWMN